jgi:hypothetical protein
MARTKVQSAGYLMTLTINVFLAFCLVVLGYQVRLSRWVPVNNTADYQIKSLKLVRDSAGIDTPHQLLEETHCELDLLAASQLTQQGSVVAPDFNPLQLQQRINAYSSYLRPPPALG